MKVESLSVRYGADDQPVEVTFITEEGVHLFEMSRAVATSLCGQLFGVSGQGVSSHGAYAGNLVDVSGSIDMRASPKV